MSITQVREYLDLVKFSHTLFALPFALLGATLAAHGPDGWHGRVQDWVGILLCMATARSAAMAFNRLADRHYDALNPRTAGRHLPAGRLSVLARRGLHPGLRVGLRSRRRSCSCPTAGRCTCPFPCSCGSWAIPTASGSPAWRISGWGSRSAWRQSRPGSRLRGDLEWPPVLLGAGRAALGIGIRYHLRMPGRGVRPLGRAPQRPEGARSSPRSLDRSRVPRLDDRARW